MGRASHDRHAQSVSAELAPASADPESESAYDSWADIYDSIYSYVRADIPFYVGEALDSAGPTLELGVGTGRVAIPTAARGGDVVGVDSSAAMLSAARRKIEALGPSLGTLELVAADMRDFDLRDSRGAERKFALATIPFRGVQALMTVQDQVRALRSVHRHLQPRGRLAFDVFVPDPYMALEQSDVPRHLRDVTDPETGDSYVLYQQTGYDFYNQIVSVRMLIEELDGSGAVRRKMYRDYQLRYCHRWEIHHLLRCCGFEIEALYGDFDRSEFDETSTQMIWVARKV